MIRRFALVVGALVLSGCQGEEAGSKMPIRALKTHLVTPQDAVLTRRCLQRDVFRCFVDLSAAINRFLKEHNATEAKPFRWAADPDRIIAARS